MLLTTIVLCISVAPNNLHARALWQDAVGFWWALAKFVLGTGRLSTPKNCSTQVRLPVQWHNAPPVHTSHYLPPLASSQTWALPQSLVLVLALLLEDILLIASPTVCPVWGHSACMQTSDSPFLLSFIVLHRAQKKNSNDNDQRVRYAWHMHLPSLYFKEHKKRIPTIMNSASWFQQ